MTFTEKLRRLTEDRIKTKICRRAGLSANAINDYVSKGYLPRIDTAVRLAKALEVSVSWLIDDTKEWPPEWEAARGATNAA